MPLLMPIFRCAFLSHVLDLAESGRMLLDRIVQQIYISRQSFPSQAGNFKAVVAHWRAITVIR